MSTSVEPTTAPDRRRHAGRACRAARLGLVVAVVAVTATVGVGTWVLGSGADAAPSGESEPTSVSVPGTSQPPLSVAPPPAERDQQRASRTTSRAAKKSTSAG